MLRIVKKEAVLGAEKPLVFSDSVAGGCTRLTGVGIFIPAIENQFASSFIVPSSNQSIMVNPMIMERLFVRADLPNVGQREIHLTDGTSEHNYALTKVSENSYKLTNKEIINESRTYYLTETNPSVQSFTNQYYGKDSDYSFDGIKRDTLVQTDNPSAVAKFAITLKKSDTLTFDLESGLLVISRTLPIFSEFNGISVRMQINNLMDNPLCDIYNPKITLPFTMNPTTTEEAMRGMKKALFFNVFEDKRLIPIDYTIKKHTKLDFIIDLSAGNIINEDYRGEKCDLKVYLRYE